MAYDVTLVQYNSFGPGGLSGTGTFGFPTTNFNYLVASMWVCLPFVGGNGCDIGMSDLNVFDVLASSRALGGLPDNKITLNLTTTNNLGQNISMYSATFGGLTTNVRANILLSVDAQNQIVQLYVNDVPQIAISGGWVASGQFPGELSFLQFYASDFGSDGGTPLVEPAVADMYTACPGTFFDLSIEGNRRKFINTDLTPVYLGPSGALPGLGIPPVYLTVPSGGVATDFLHNYGLGPSFGLSGNITSVSFQTPGTCHLPLAASLTGVSATAQVGTLSFPTSIWAITSNVQTPSPGAVGDVWANNSYIDFSDPTVRANFENADGSWLDLGYNGATPTGSSPLLYLTVQLQQPPSDILTGYGQGGAQTHWALLDQGTNPSTGLAYPAMSFDACAPVAGNLELTDIEVTATSQIIPDNQVTLRWSDDAGASWSNGLLKTLGEAGEYFTAPSWYRLGMSRNRILELSWSGARAEALQGVFVQVTISAT